MQVFERVLMVCVGNICRSPTAEIILRHRLQGRPVQVASAGLAALSGQGIDPAAQEQLLRHGLPADGHVARQLDAGMLAAADLILVMEKSHVDAIDRMAPHVRGKTFLLGKWQGNQPIPDPYRKPQAAFELAYQMIDAAIERWRVHL